MRRFKKYSLLVSIATGVLLLAVQASGAKKVQIVWWDPYGPPFNKVAEKIISDFNKSQNNIKVVRQMIPWDGYIEKMALTMTSGKGPDCAHVWGAMNATQLWAMGLSRPMDEFVMKDKRFWEVVYPAFMDSLKYRGRQLAFPDTAQAHMLFWNKTFFSQSGLDPNRAPAFEELELYAAKLTRKKPDGRVEVGGFNPINTWGGTQAWISLFGGQLFDAKAEKVTANSGANIQALRWLSSYTKTFGGYNYLFSAGGIQDGKVAMELAPHYVMKYIGSSKKKINYMIGLPPAPGGLGNGKGPMVSLNCNIVLRGSKHPEAAYEFLKFFVSNGGWMQPDTPDASPNRILNEKFNPPSIVPEGTWKAVALKVLDIARPSLSMPGAEKYVAELDSRVYQVLNGKKSPEQALQETQIAGEKQFQAALKRARWGK